MPADLRFLALSALLCLAQALPYSHGIILRPEVMKGGLGDRGLGEGLTGWASRARRSHVNMVETLVPFTALVLSAHVLARVSTVDVLGVEVFFAARSVHVLASLLGVAWLRKLAWHMSLFGVALVALALFLPT